MFVNLRGYIKIVEVEMINKNLSNVKIKFNNCKLYFSLFYIIKTNKKLISINFI